MNCLVRIKKIKDGMAIEGSSVVLTLVEFEKIKKSILNNVLIDMDNENELHNIYEPDKSFKQRWLREFFRTTDDKEMFAKIKELGNPVNGIKQTLAHIVAEKGHDFSVDELIELGNPINELEDTVAHLMIFRGYKFSVKDLMKLGNMSDTSLISMAHQMVAVGHKFTVQELLELGNPSDEDGNTIAHWMIKERHGYTFTLKELLDLGNPPNVDGFTLAHEMINGMDHSFTVDEILALGNPSDIAGNTLSSLMELKGHKFTLSEKERLLRARE